MLMHCIHELYMLKGDMHMGCIIMHMGCIIMHMGCINMLIGLHNALQLNGYGLHNALQLIANWVA